MIKWDPIIFIEKDLPAGEVSCGDPLVIALDLIGTLVRRVLVDTGSSVNVMYHDVFIKLGLSKEQLTLTKTPLANFTGDIVGDRGLHNPPGGGREGANRETHGHGVRGVQAQMRPQPNLGTPRDSQNRGAHLNGAPVHQVPHPEGYRYPEG